MPATDKSNAAPTGSVALAAVLLMVAALSWAGNYVTGRVIAGEVPPAGLAVARWAVAVLVLLPLAWPHLRRDWPVISGRGGYMLVMGLCGAAVFGTLQYAGLQYTTATNGGLISATSAVMIALAGVILFGDRLSIRQVLGMAISMTGAFVIVARGDLANLASLRLNIGDLMILTTLVSWGLYCALLRLKPAVHWTSFTLALFVVALLANLPVALIEHAWGRPLQATATTIAAVIYTGVVSSVIGFVVWNRGVEIIGSPRAGVYLNLIPIFTVLLAMLFLGEQLQRFHVVACVLVFSGLWLATTGPGRRGA